MTKIFLIVNLEHQLELSNYLNENNFEIQNSLGSIEDILTQLNNFMPDIILIDSDFENAEFITRQINQTAKQNNTQVILLLNPQNETNYLDYTDGIVEKPLKNNILLATINSHLKNKLSLDRLSENNKELSRSLYQLNVLYNTSSQFAGTLNTNRLYEIMIEAMEKTLSFDILSILIYSPTSKPIFQLNTIHMPSEILTDALKIRSIINYKTIFSEANITNQKDFKDVEIVQKIKQARTNKIYGIESISYDSMFAPIKVGEEFFGVVELFRQVPFSNEDVTCFQAITHQVALPLRSAKLYEEIASTNKKLEKLEKLKSEFVSIVSHELRTPLTPINNSLEIILNGQAGPITPEALNFISMTKRNIQRLSAIIEDLLDLSRIQTGKLDLKYKTIDITPSLELLEKTFYQTALEKNINFSLEIANNLPEIYGDSRRIEQILTNLVSNSLKFTHNKGEIKINAKVVSSNDINQEKLINPTSKLIGDYIQITVEDNGIGINQNDIPKIFDKFSQIESSLNRNKGGVGLGLTITKQLIDSHMGAIWVNSEEKIGSKFNVLLPVIDNLKTFKMDLSKALNNSTDIGIIKINYDKNLNLIESLKEQKILNFSKLSKETTLYQNDKNTYLVFIPKITQNSLETLFELIKEFSEKIKTSEHDIILSKLHCSQFGSNIEDIFEALN